jgi:hypothetical protein
MACINVYSDVFTNIRVVFFKTTDVLSSMHTRCSGDVGGDQAAMQPTASCLLVRTTKDLRKFCEKPNQKREAQHLIVLPKAYDNPIISN